MEPERFVSHRITNRAQIVKITFELLDLVLGLELRGDQHYHVDTTLEGERCEKTVVKRGLHFVALNPVTKHEVDDGSA